MYVLRRVLKPQPQKAWEVANYLAKTCQAYEEGGRNKAQLYIGGQGLPGTPAVYAEWAQERIEPNWASKVPEAVRVNNAKFRPLLTEEWSLELYELVTPEKLQERGLS